MAKKLTEAQRAALDTIKAVPGATFAGSNVNDVGARKVATRPIDAVINAAFYNEGSEPARGVYRFGSGTILVNHGPKGSSYTYKPEAVR